MIRVMEGQEVFGPLHGELISNRRCLRKKKTWNRGRPDQTRGRRLAVGSLWKWTRREEALPHAGEKKEWVEVKAWPKFVADL